MRTSLLVSLLLGMTSAVVMSPATPSAPSPWMDTSLCPLTDSLMVCQLKKGMCSPINTIFSPPGGPLKAIITCANSTGVTLGPQFFMSVGLSFIAGSPESLADKASSDPTTATAMRRCALNATGLLNPDLLTLNRTAVSNSLSDAFVSPELGEAVSSAVTTCPEPVDYKLTSFINCLKTACMNNVAVTPFMTQAASVLTGAGAPAAAAAAVVAAKKPAPKVPAVSPGASYAGAAGGASAGGAASYMAGAFPFAGAGGAGGAAPASGASSYMGGAFPFAGAGAGAYPFAGAAGGASGAGAPVGAPGAGAFTYPGAGAAGGAGGAGAFTFPSSSGGAPVA